MAKIKKDTSLRKAILQAAITGQLISNVDEETETGKQLLDRIIEERNKKLLAEWEEKLKENPKTKKPVPIVVSEIDDDEIPFEIPESWCWCRLGDVVTILGDGLHGTPKFDISGEYYFVNGNNLNNGIIEIKSDTKKVNEKEYEKYKKDLNKYTIFVSINGTIGNIAFYNNEKIVLGKSACYFNVAIEDLKKFFFYLFNTDFFLTYALDNATGTTIKNVGLGTMRNFIFPLPPLAVQNAIVAKLEEVLPFVDAYENVVLQKEELKNALPDKVKKAILQEAIQGKLTEDWRKTATIEETGKQLLDRIIEERNAKLLAEWEEAKKKTPKAKKPTLIVASEIDEEEILFEVPDSWYWCRLGDVVDTNIGLTYSPSDIVSNDGTAILRSNNIQNGKIVYDDLVFVSKNIPEKCLVNKGDLLVCARNASKSLVGKCAIIEQDGMAFGAFMAIIRSKINPYILHFINSPVYRTRLDGVNTTTINQITQDNLRETLFPLPPLAEQKKIVEIIEQMLPLCEKLGG